MAMKEVRETAMMTFRAVMTMVVRMVVRATMIMMVRQAAMGLVWKVQRRMGTEMIQVRRH